MTQAKNISIIIVLTLVSGVVLAQKGVYLGVVSGLNASFILDKGLQQDPRYVEKFTFKTVPAEFVTNINFKSTMGLKTELGISNSGQVYDVVDATKNIVGKREIDLKYITLNMLIQRIWGNDKNNISAGLGPQLLLMQKGKEVVNWASGLYNVPVEALPNNIIPNASGIYQLSEKPEEILASLENSDAGKQFSAAQLAISGGFTANIKLYKHLYLDLNFRGSYNFTDARGKDLIDGLKNGTTKDLLGRRSNLLVGVVGGIVFKL
jgi:hypothetical protein